MTTGLPPHGDTPRASANGRLNVALVDVGGSRHRSRAGAAWLHEPFQWARVRGLDGRRGHPERGGWGDHRNGVPMCELDDRNPKRLVRGALALQNYVGAPVRVQFKDIYFKRL